MTIETQYEIYLKQITSRKRNPVKGATLAAYRSYYRNWIHPNIGKLEVSAVENGTMKRLVATLAEAGLSPSTIGGVTNCVKSIVSSAVDDNGNELFPRRWNSDFIDAPIIDPKAQNAPVIAAPAVAKAISQAPSQYAPLFALLAGTGLRISEALALKVGPQPSSSFWDPEQSKLVIRKALYHGVEQATKTAAGVREVDLAPELNEYLLSHAASQGFLFADTNGKPLCVSTAYVAADKAEVPGYHSFRRFRITHLENQGVPRGLVMFWTGHAGKDVHDRYVKLSKDIEARKEWAEKAGLGFKLPKIQEVSDHL
jgi:integrase